MSRTALAQDDSANRSSAAGQTGDRSEFDQKIDYKMLAVEVCNTINNGIELSGFKPTFEAEGLTLTLERANPDGWLEGTYSEGEALQTKQVPITTPLLVGILTQFMQRIGHV